jgi:hypothetical protein
VAAAPGRHTVRTTLVPVAVGSQTGGSIWSPIDTIGSKIVCPARSGTKCIVQIDDTPVPRAVTLDVGGAGTGCEGQAADRLLLIRSNDTSLGLLAGDKLVFTRTVGTDVNRFSVPLAGGAEVTLGAGAGSRYLVAAHENVPMVGF